MQDTQKALHEFYKDTRHRPHDIDTPKQVELLTKKYIALHCKKGVYSFVANDLNRLDKRTDGGVIARYGNRHIDSNVHNYLFSNLESYINNPVLRDFQQQAIPRPEKEQRWQTHKCQP